MAGTVVSDDKLKGAIAYLGWWVTGIVFLLTEKKNEYIRFHAMQSTVVFGTITLLYIILGIVPIIGWIIGFILSFVMWPLAFVIWLVLMWKAYNGEKYKLPYFGDLAERQLTKLK